MAGVTRIIGIDPGLRRTGWGIITIEGSRLGFVAAGSIEPPTDGALAARLAALHRGVAEIIETYQPDEAAVEEVFVNKDPRSTLKLGQARGAAMTALGLARLHVEEFAPNRIKKSVVGAGHAEKAQIRLMVKVLLPKANFRSDDAADALAVAICQAHHRGSGDLASLIRRTA